MLNKDLEIIQGNDQIYSLTFKDSAGVIDISQWIILYVVKDKQKQPVFNKTITNHTDPTHGVSKIILMNQETNIELGKYRYSLTVRTGAGEIYSILSGSLIVREP